MGEKVEVKLFSSRYSPFGQRIQIALTEKGIPFDLIIVDFANKPKLLLEANPIYKRVPAIIHNGKPVVESLVILEYLEEAWPEQVPLMPKDAFEKSRVRFWADYIYKAFATIGGSFAIQPGTPEKVAANKASVEHLKTLDAAMTELSVAGPFFAGDKFGYLDVVLAPLCHAKVILEQLGGAVIPGPDEMPRLHKWFEIINLHPSVKASVPSSEEALTFLSDMFKRRIAASKAAVAAAAQAPARQ